MSVGLVGASIGSFHPHKALPVGQAGQCRLPARFPVTPSEALPHPRPQYTAPIPVRETHLSLPGGIMRYRITPFALIACTMVLMAACGETNTAPDDTELFSEAADLSAAGDQQAGSTVAWNAIGRQLIKDRAVTAADIQGRILSYLSLAQYNAIVGAEREKDRGRRASSASAAAGASVVVLTSFFPNDAAFLEATLQAQFPAEASEGAARRQD